MRGSSLPRAKFNRLKQPSGLGHNVCLSVCFVVPHPPTNPYFPDRNIAQKLLWIKGEGVWRIARHCAHRQPIEAGGGADLPYGGKKAEIQAVTVIPCHV